MNPNPALFRLLAILLLALLSSCAVTKKDGLVPDASDLAIYVSKPLASMHFTVADLESKIQFDGAGVTVPKPANPKVPKSQVQAYSSSRAGSRDAMTLRWQDAWSAILRIEGSQPLDLRPFVSDGTLEFDLDVAKMAQGGLAFTVTCGDGCERKVPFVLAARALEGKGWQHLSFSMRCFARDGDAFDAVRQPFALDANGTGEVAVANVHFVRRGTANTQCPDYRTVSVTPEPLNEAWSIDWWLQRHQHKLDQVRTQLKTNVHSDVVFIGDSITDGWEKGGRTVWDSHYAQYNALDLGFSGDRTENVIWRLQHGELEGLSPKITVLLIGTNNTGHRQEDPRTTAAGVRRVIDEIRGRLPSTKILLLAVFPREERSTSPLRVINDRVNEIIGGFADDKKIFFLNINPFLLNSDGSLSRDIMPDLLHPNERGYSIWATQMQTTLLKLMSAP